MSPREGMPFGSWNTDLSFLKGLETWKNQQVPAGPGLTATLPMGMGGGNPMMTAPSGELPWMQKFQDISKSWQDRATKAAGPPPWMQNFQDMNKLWQGRASRFAAPVSAGQRFWSGGAGFAGAYGGSNPVTELY